MTAHERLAKARSALLLRQPFWGTLALHLRLEEKPEVETISTDGVKIYFAPDFVMSLPFDQLQGVVAHEVSHCAYRHHSRRGKRELGLWNDAADYVINPLLLKAGMKLPPDVLNEPKFAGLGAEEVYARLQADREAKKAAKAAGGGSSDQKNAGAGTQSPQPGQTPAQPQPGSQPSNSSASDGTGSGGQKQPGSGTCSWGKVQEPAKESAPANIAALDAEWGVRVRQALAVARKQHAGHLPDDIERLAEDIAKPAQVDWRERMRQFLDDKVVFNYTWAKRNKRFPNDILPGHIVDSIQKIGIVIDTSGSIDQRMLSAFATEIQDLMSTGMVNELVVTYCDTEVARVERFTMGDTVKLNAKGGGGTKFSPALLWFSDNEPDANAILYFTDLQCDDYGPEPSQPILWLAHGYESTINKLVAKVPFGEVVHLAP